MNGFKRDKSRINIKKAQEKVENPACLSLTVEELEKFKSNTLHALLKISIQKLKAVQLHRKLTVEGHYWSSTEVIEMRHVTYNRPAPPPWADLLQVLLRQRSITHPTDQQQDSIDVKNSRSLVLIAHLQGITFHFPQCMKTHCFSMGLPHPTSLIHPRSDFGTQWWIPSGWTSFLFCDEVNTVVLCFISFSHCWYLVYVAKYYH